MKPLTAASVEKLVASENYYLIPGSTVMVCTLTLVNGFVVTGESVCIDPAQYEADVGRAIARDRAKDKIWALEGYALRDRAWQKSKRRKPQK
jgi:hypothetical protein